MLKRCIVGHIVAAFILLSSVMAEEPPTRSI